MLLRLSIAILALSPAVVSITIFTPNCTASNETVNFVTRTGYRSTLDILWSSLFTIVACTWTILHLNVPEQRNGRDPGSLGDLKWMIKRIRQNLKWMMITIIAPEWTLGFAAMRLEGALRSREQFKPLAAIDDIEWTLEHDFYANMGAFAIKVKLPPQRTRSSETEGDGMDSVIFHLTSKSLLTLRQKGYIKRLPRITKEQINDRSKSDIFTKLITATQVFSTIIQVIVRRSRNLAISQLELAVTAFSVCAMIIYLLTLYQPKGVQTIEVLHSEHQDLSFEKAYEICVAGRESSWFSEWRDKSYFLHGGVDDRIRNDWEDSRGDNISAIGLFFGGIIFGAVHCSGWFFAFPTVQELLLWRIASVLTTSVPIVMLGVSWFAADWDDWRRTILWYVTLVSIALYVIARLFIMVEAFRSLFYLPYDAFISTWADNIPHLS